MMLRASLWRPSVRPGASPRPTWRETLGSPDPSPARGLGQLGDPRYGAAVGRCRLAGGVGGPHATRARGGSGTGPPTSPWAPPHPRTASASIQRSSPEASAASSASPDVGSSAWRCRPWMAASAPETFCWSSSTTNLICSTLLALSSRATSPSGGPLASSSAAKSRRSCSVSCTASKAPWSSWLPFRMDRNSWARAQTQASISDMSAAACPWYWISLSHRCLRKRFSRSRFAEPIQVMTNTRDAPTVAKVRSDATGEALAA
mmetsp:Transcript_108719/g.307512  ORF Transcript_108719/g.307512 Transcript_108719/m.307512 type:complete len:261 (+) Transcript_108719:53-835(+)